MQGHFGLERQPPVPALGVERGLDLGGSLDLDQFAGLEVEFGRERLLLLAGKLVVSPAAEQPPQAIPERQPQDIGKPPRGDLAQPEVVQVVPQLARRKLGGGPGQLGRLAIEAVAFGGGKGNEEGSGIRDWGLGRSHVLPIPQSLIP